MGQPAVAALTPPPFDDLIFSDGEPLETDWHAIQFPYLWALIREAMTEQGRSNFFVGGNMFVYYSAEQAWDVIEGRPYFRGPDVFFVDNVDPHPRPGWVSWEEGGRFPDVIVELLSPSTARIDRTEKKDLYARVFRTSEYFLYEPATLKLEGFRLQDLAYRPLTPAGNGRIWSERLGAFLGLWRGTVLGREDQWVRLFRPDGSLVPSKDEWIEAERQRAEAERQRAEAERQRAEAERQRAEAERQRAESAEAELTRLRALLAERESG